MAQHEHLKQNPLDPSDMSPEQYITASLVGGKFMQATEIYRKQYIRLGVYQMLTMIIQAKITMQDSDLRDLLQLSMFLDNMRLPNPLRKSRMRRWQINMMM